MLVISFIVLLTLSGCTPKECKPTIVYETKYIKQAIPEALLEASPVPKVPKVDTQADVAIYLTEIYFYANSLFNNITKIKALVDINTSK